MWVALVEVTQTSPRFYLSREYETEEEAQSFVRRKEMCFGRCVTDSIIVRTGCGSGWCGFEAFEPYAVLV